MLTTFTLYLGDELLGSAIYDHRMLMTAKDVRITLINPPDHHIIVDQWPHGTDWSANTNNVRLVINPIRSTGPRGSIGNDATFYREYAQHIIQQHVNPIRTVGTPHVPRARVRMVDVYHVTMREINKPILRTFTGYSCEAGYKFPTGVFQLDNHEFQVKQTLTIVVSRGGTCLWDKVGKCLEKARNGVSIGDELVEIIAPNDDCVDVDFDSD